MIQVRILTTLNALNKAEILSQWQISKADMIWMQINKLIIIHEYKLTVQHTEQH